MQSYHTVRQSLDLSTATQAKRRAQVPIPAVEPRTVADLPHSRLLQQTLALERLVDGVLARRTIEFQDALEARSVQEPGWATCRVHIFQEILNQGPSQRSTHRGMVPTDMSEAVGRPTPQLGSRSQSRGPTRISIGAKDKKKSSPSYDTAEPPSWRLSVVGQLIDGESKKPHPLSAVMFSNVLSKLYIHLDPQAYPGRSGVAEWVKGVDQNATHGFQMSRVGDKESDVRVSLYFDACPRLHLLSKELRSMLIPTQSDSRVFPHEMTSTEVYFHLVRYMTDKGLVSVPDLKRTMPIEQEDGEASASDQTDDAPSGKKSGKGGGRSAPQKRTTRQSKNKKKAGSKGSADTGEDGEEAPMEDTDDRAGADKDKAQNSTEGTAPQTTGTLTTKQSDTQDSKKQPPQPQTAQTVDCSAYLDGVETQEEVPYWTDLNESEGRIIRLNNKLKQLFSDDTDVLRRYWLARRRERLRRFMHFLKPQKGSEPGTGGGKPPQHQTTHSAPAQEEKSTAQEEGAETKNDTEEGAAALEEKQWARYVKACRRYDPLDRFSVEQEEEGGKASGASASFQTPAFLFNGETGNPSNPLPAVRLPDALTVDELLLLVEQHLAPATPVVLRHRLRFSGDTHDTASVYDIRFRLPRILAHTRRAMATARRPVGLSRTPSAQEWSGESPRRGNGKYGNLLDYVRLYAQSDGPLPPPMPAPTFSSGLYPPHMPAESNGNLHRMALAYAAAQAEELTAVTRLLNAFVLDPHRMLHSEIASRAAELVSSKSSGEGTQQTSTTGAGESKQAQTPKPETSATAGAAPSSAAASVTTTSSVDQSSDGQDEADAGVQDQDAKDAEDSVLAGLPHISEPELRAKSYYDAWVEDAVLRYMQAEDEHVESMYINDPFNAFYPTRQ